MAQRWREGEVSFPLRARRRKIGGMDERHIPESPLGAFLVGLLPIGLTIMGVIATLMPGGLVIGTAAVSGAVFILLVVRFTNRRGAHRRTKADRRACIRPAGGG